MSFVSAMKVIKEKFMIFYEFRDKQVEAIQVLVEGKHVFCIVPTGYGKSDIDGLPCLVHDEVSVLYISVTHNASKS